MNRKNLVILGATGSIGQSTCEVVRRHPECFQVSAVVCRNHYEALAQKANCVKAQKAIVTDASCIAGLRRSLAAGIQAAAGRDAMLEVVTDPQVDIVLCGMDGTAGILPVLAALKAGKTVALASKEVLVAAGNLVMQCARQNGGRILPVDSEHSAIFQCLENRMPGTWQKLILTASGGAFRDWPLERLANATPEDALLHPTWRMGRKVTIDSATMMNKTLELIEAHHLFQAAPSQISVLLHRESIVHSLVEFCDNSLLALLSQPDMQLAIQYALSYPERWSAAVPHLDLGQLGALHFEQVDLRRFPALELAKQVIEQGGLSGAVLNAANEVAVQGFLDRRLRFTDIYEVVASTLAALGNQAAPGLDELLAADQEARRLAECQIVQIGKK